MRERQDKESDSNCITTLRAGENAIVTWAECAKQFKLCRTGPDSSWIEV